MKRTAIKELSAANIDSKPIDADWQGGHGESWEYYSASKCDKCGQKVNGSGESEKHSDADSGSDCDGYVNNPAPMMDYWYPLDVSGNFDPSEAAKLIEDLPLCIVNMGIGPASADAYGLALTGGGMDFSWEICEAFMRLGELPPLHFQPCEMCGRGASAGDKWILAGCKRTAQIVISRGRERIADLRRLKVRSAQYEARRPEKAA